MYEEDIQLMRDAEGVFKRRLREWKYYLPPRLTDVCKQLVVAVQMAEAPNNPAFRTMTAKTDQGEFCFKFPMPGPAAAGTAAAPLLLEKMRQHMIANGIKSISTTKVASEFVILQGPNLLDVVSVFFDVYINPALIKMGEEKYDYRKLLAEETTINVDPQRAVVGDQSQQVDTRQQNPQQLLGSTQQQPNNGNQQQKGDGAATGQSGDFAARIGSSQQAGGFVAQITNPIQQQQGHASANDPMQAGGASVVSFRR